MLTDLRMTHESIDAARLLEEAGGTGDGAVNCFIGRVRTTSGTEGRQGTVVRLEYEAFEPMALAEMQRIAVEIEQEFRPTSLAIHHRVGTLAPGEVAVAVVLATPHRAASFEACRYAIEEVKKRVPIWKKEVFTDGAEWVDPRP